MKIQFDQNRGATVDTRLYEYGALKQEQQPYITAAREVSEWLVPGRGLYSIHSKPRNRDLVPRKVVNPKAKQALEVLVSFLKDGICPSSRPWFMYHFEDSILKENRSLQIWANEVQEELRYQLREANYYSLATTYFKELCSFCTSSMGVFPGIEKALNFSPLTFGEYSIGTNSEGVVDRLYRTLFKNFYQLLHQFGDNLPAELLEKFYNRDQSLDMWYTVVEGVVPEQFLDMPYTRFFILVADSNTKHSGGVKGKLPSDNKYEDFIHVEGVNEFPYPTTRFDVLSGEDYGVGPGFEAVNVIKRLQEVVKSGAVAYHKSIRPPWNIPVSMKNSANTYPDAHNYYINPDEIIRPAQDVRFDHRSAEVMEGRLEQTLKEIFFNDIFLTTSRDPNASPLKARQVDEISNDKYARLGPYLERIFYEGTQPQLNRSLAILDRQGRLPKLPDEFKDLKSKATINLTSLLAQSVKSRAAIPMMEYLQIVGAVGQVNPSAYDVPNTDAFLMEMADIKNIPPHLNYTSEQIAQTRKARQEAMAQKNAQEQQALGSQQQAELEAVQAGALKDRAVAGESLADNLGSGGTLL